MTFAVGKRVKKVGKDYKFVGQILSVGITRRSKMPVYVLESDDGILITTGEQEMSEVGEEEK